jgi:hypothetical protein
MIPSPTLSRVPVQDAVSDPTALPFPVPGWMASLDDQAPETLRFLAGAGLAQLHPLALGRYPAVPLSVLIDRQALASAAVVLRMMGRREDLRALRDALHLRRPGEAPGRATTAGHYAPHSASSSSGMDERKFGTLSTGTRPFKRPRLTLGACAGTSRATGFPPRVMITSSPRSTAATSSESIALVSEIFISMTSPLADGDSIVVRLISIRMASGLQLQTRGRSGG